MSTIRLRSDGVDRTTGDELDADTKETVAQKVFENFVSSARLHKMNRSSRRSICDLPRNHFGPVPNVPVGASWRYRIQVS